MELDLSFKMKTKGQNEENETDVSTLKGNFHEADIEDELILGYPWLQENNLAVRKTEGALGCGWKNEIILTGWGEQDPDEVKQRDDNPIT